VVPAVFKAVVAPQGARWVRFLPSPIFCHAGCQAPDVVKTECIPMNVPQDIAGSNDPPAPATHQAPQSRAKPQHPHRLLAFACWAYLLVVVFAAIALPVLGDRWWFCTLLLFGARWPWAAPLALLVPLAFTFRRRSLAALALTTLLAFGSILDLRLPWRAWLNRPPANSSAQTLRIVTWNVHGCIQMDTPVAATWLASQHADVIAFEEWPPGRPVDPLVGEGWNVLHDGELCVLSRLPIRRAVPPAFGSTFAAHGAGARYRITTPGGDIPLAAIHLASPHPEFSAALRMNADSQALIAQNTARRTSQAAAVREWARGIGPRAIIVGDFNTPSDSPIFRSLQDELTDAFLTAGTGFGVTYYHRAAFARIDHVMFGNAWSCSRCIVGPALGSPHRPLVAELWVPPT
jgi:vancomycin resistance protein VanJ